MRNVSNNARRLLALAVTAALAGCASAPPPRRAKAAAPVTGADRAPKALPPCPDGDRDGVCNADDRCPTAAGPQAAFGCPINPCGTSPLMVLVQFKYDSSEMPAQKLGVQTMDPVLDAVAKAIAQDATCRVCVLGYASEEGTAAYNEDLSRRRAAAVQDYLIARGLPTMRMPTTGMGERCQLVPERSRELNRRVEFRRLREGESCPRDCSG